MGAWENACPIRMVRAFLFRGSVLSLDDVATPFAQIYVPGPRPHGPPPRKGFKTDYLTCQILRCVVERTFVLDGLESGKSGKSVQNTYFVL